MVANVSFDGTVAPALGFIPNGMLGQDSWPVDGWGYDLDGHARQFWIRHMALPRTFHLSPSMPMDRPIG